MRCDAMLDFINFIILRHSTNADRYCFIITVDSIFSCTEHWEQTLSQTMNITINQSCHMVGFVFGTRVYRCVFFESMFMYSNFFPSLTFISSILIIYLQPLLHIRLVDFYSFSATADVAAAAAVFVFLSLVGKGFSEYFVVTHTISVDLLNGIENGEQKCAKRLNL